MRQNYVLGFVLTIPTGEIILVKKEKGPPINIGKWNGIGEKVEVDEDPLQAIQREWSEEVGIALPEPRTHIGEFAGPDFCVYLYKNIVDTFFNSDFLPPTNDVGEELRALDLGGIVFGGEGAQNLSVMVMHALSGQGKI